MRKVGLIAAAALVVALPLATLSASAQTRRARGGVAARAAGQIGGGAGFGGGAMRVAAPSAPAPSVAAPSVVDLRFEAARSPPVRASASDRRRTGADVRAGAAVPAGTAAGAIMVAAGSDLASASVPASPSARTRPHLIITATTIRIITTTRMTSGVVVGSSGASPEDVAYCQRRYRSYDVNSGTFLGNDGRRHPCP